MNDKSEAIPQNSCNQCGTCCRKGGPAFHREDKELLECGRIKMVDVYTIREGEPIYDNVREIVAAAETDIIKIKGTGDSWTCRFLEQSKNSCCIYEDRPAECRVMKCWDTREIESLYAVDRLVRRDLLAGVDGLWELIEDHHSRCSYHNIRRLIQDGDGNLEGEAAKQVLEMIKYDLSIRPMMVEKGQLDSEMLEFLLGRPIIEVITLFGLDVVRDGDSFHFEPRKQSPGI